MPQIVQVNMLGRFSIAPEGVMSPKELSFSSRSRRLWMLIAYFIMHRDRGIPPQELIDLFWPDGEADLVTLQNNVSRARAALRNLGFSSGLHLITCRDGLYRWDPQLETDLDADRFDELCNRTFACPEPEARLENALAAAALYEGDFLSEVALEPWCIHLNTYLHGRYLRLCRELVRMLSEGGRLEEALAICTKAIQLDPAAEDFSVEFIKLETLLGHPNKAMEHYNRIRNLYRETYNVSVSPEMEAAHTAAIRSQFGKEMEISEIRSFMTQGGPAAGAFLCDNTVFPGNRKPVHPGTAPQRPANAAGGHVSGSRKPSSGRTGSGHETAGAVHHRHAARRRPVYKGQLQPVYGPPPRLQRRRRHLRHEPHHQPSAPFLPQACFRIPLSAFRSEGSG